MKKRAFIYMCILLLGCVICCLIIFDGNKSLNNIQTTQNDRIDEVSNSSGWTLFSDKYFQVIDICFGNPLLKRILVQSDFDEIHESLVDKKSRAMTKEEIEAIKNDPNAHMVDNVTEDGYYLKDNWVQIEQNMVEAKSIERFMYGSGMSIMPFETFKATYEEYNRVKTMKFQKFYNGNTIVIPKDTYSGLSRFTMTPDCKKFFIECRDSLWQINSKTNQLEKISDSTYNGKTYEELDKEAYESNPYNNCYWNENIHTSPDSKKLAYISNKNDVNKFEIFIFDIETKQEIKISEDKYAENIIIGWLNKNQLLYERYFDNGEKEIVVYNLNGERVKIGQRETDECSMVHEIHEIKDNMISYTNSSDNKTINIIEFDGESRLRAKRKETLDGSIRWRYGKKFNLNNTYFACMYRTNEEDFTTHIAILDLNSNDIIKINELPKEVDKSAFIIEFSWIDDNKLLINIEEKIDGKEKISTWIYTLNEKNFNMK
ncbi:hypothetical protein PV797_08305 [Clostridiaceae bacterium M8S5]|nr:hypothetical protein PV797_08305 [Clostridiaceae bacterium M8S5]